MEEARAMEGLGRCQIQDGNPAEATTQLRQALAIYQRIGSPNAVGLQQFLDEIAAEPGSRRGPAQAVT